MRLFLFVALISCIIFSCDSAPKDNESAIDSAQEIELITQLLPTLIGPNSFPPGPPPYFNPAVETREQYEEKLRESFQKHLERIADSIFKLTFSAVLEVVSENQIAGIDDTSFSELKRILVADTLGTKAIEIEKIAPFLPYQLVDEPEKRDKYDFMYRGAVSFSRVAFNKNYTKALFRFDFRCNFDCGWGAFILAEKKDGQWKIIKTYGLWVA